MERKEFLKSLGLGGAAIIAVYCTGCSLNGDNAITPAGNVDLTLDLTDPANAALNTDGGFIVTKGLVIARTTNGLYVAVTQVCSHEGHPNVTYLKSSNSFYCNVHGAMYDTSGRGLNSNGRNGLTTYKTEITGTSLRIFS